MFFLLFYGVKQYYVCNEVRSFRKCQLCTTYGAQDSYQSRRYFHIFDIPLFPVGATSQTLNKCDFCGESVNMSLESVAPMVDSLKAQFKSWIAEVQHGRTEIIVEQGAAPVNVGVLIASLIEDLYCLNEIQDIQSILRILHSYNLAFEIAIVQGRWCEINGDLQQAKQFYLSAYRLKPDNPVTLYQMGTIDVKLGNIVGAEASFGRYLAMRPNDVSVYQELASLYDRLENDPKFISTWDILFTLNPGLMADFGTIRRYQRVCKKSGIPGKFLNQM